MSLRDILGNKNSVFNWESRLLANIEENREQRKQQIMNVVKKEVSIPIVPPKPEKNNEIRNVIVSKDFVMGEEVQHTPVSKRTKKFFNLKSDDIAFDDSDNVAKDDNSEYENEKSPPKDDDYDSFLEEVDDEEDSDEEQVAEIGETRNKGEVLKQELEDVGKFLLSTSLKNITATKHKNGLTYQLEGKTISSFSDVDKLKELQKQLQTQITQNMTPAQKKVISNMKKQVVRGLKTFNVKSPAGRPKKVKVSIDSLREKKTN